MTGSTTPTVGTMPEQHRPAVVGIGASAGGLEALKAFFGAMPARTGLVFVVVVHLDPTHESLMPELLSHVTGLTVEQARDRQPLEADHVYVIPPNRTLTIDQGLLRVREVADRQSLRGAIDHFFRSLAEVERDRGVAVVLSGTGTEGTLGSRAVKAEGGLVIAQAPDTAAQPGMPASVIATGLVDVVLAPDKMPQALLAYVRHANHASPATTEAEPSEGLPAILAVLRARTKYDFRGYKLGTLQRRIERRMGLQQIDTISRYLDFLRLHPAEVDQLFKDLLIGVTSFFRDPPAFDELATKALAPLVRERDPDAPIRIWVPGCSTGEEAYSVAIAVAEQIAAAQSACRVQIFATDVDDSALARARTGSYPESIALDVSPQRLQRFFTRDDHRYLIAKSIRVQQLESNNEELKAANEEVLSMNEELQSTNEELTTSKEELQSMNEELTTLNAQLQDKVHQLTVLNDDLANLLVSTDIATVFLDTELRIKRFTTAASHVLNLRMSDTGRPMNHIASNLIDPDLSRDARTVLRTETTLEKEVGAQADGDVVVTSETHPRLHYTLRQLPGIVQFSAAGRDEAERLARGFGQRYAVDVWYSEAGAYRLLEAYRPQPATQAFVRQTDDGLSKD